MDAAILQPPLFDPDAEDAVNYGGIGAMIGHEIQHAFDRQGRQIDAEGAPRDWWSAKDSEAFQVREEMLVDQFDRYREGGASVNGQATLTENAADLGGLAIAAHAYVLSLNGKASPQIDGFTGDQRLLIRWAQLWRTQSRDEYLRQALLINQHAPPHTRANGAAANLDVFYRAFSVHQGDALYIRPERRVRIW
jgi:putative endopeptidase